jgi:capsular exopolysaccharide synthesis family protein
VERDLAVVKKQEAGLSKLFEAAKTQALDLNLLEIEYNRLRRSKENTEKLYQLVLERTKESDLTRMLRVNNLRIIDAPLVPRSPVSPRVPINIALGIFVGLVLGVSAAIGCALLDRTLKTPDDVERELGHAFLGLLPEIDDGSHKPSYYGRRKRGRPASGGGKRELIVHEHPSSGLAEASRAIRTNLMFSSPDHPFQTLLVTSAGPAEGKTTVACCLAIAMAQAGQRVLLLDCDLRRPRLHRVFNKTSEFGITTCLLEDSLEYAALPTDVPNLSVIPAGPLPPNPAELVHSERFRTMLQRLSKQYDRIIIDSPPLVPVTDAAILSTLVDATVLVIKGFATRKELARQAARALADVGAKMAGVVLNAINLDRHEYKYYYYYYKRDNYYSADRSGGSQIPPQQPPSAGAMPPN